VIAENREFFCFVLYSSFLPNKTNRKKLISYKCRSSSPLQLPKTVWLSVAYCRDIYGFSCVCVFYFFRVSNWIELLRERWPPPYWMVPRWEKLRILEIL